MVLHEITPRDSSSLLFSKATLEDTLDFPLHFHEEFELNLTIGVSGKRLVGTSIEPFSPLDLTLIAPRVVHCYSGVPVDSGSNVAVVQFPNLIDIPFFQRSEMLSIKQFLQRSLSGGIVFGSETAKLLQDKILALPEAEGFRKVLLFLEILDELSRSQDQRFFNEETDPVAQAGIKNDSVKKIVDYIATNYMRQVTLEEIAAEVNMTTYSASRMFKRKTGRGLWDYLSDCRIKHVTRMLVETDLSIAEVAYGCGFSNMSNFHRIFRQRMNGTTPQEYRRRAGIARNI